VATALPVHPFPARMAPDLAFEHLPLSLDRACTVLDPMMGSGTIPIMASLRGYRAIGFDIDPLAVLIARTAGRPLDPRRILQATERVVEVAGLRQREPFSHRDAETQEYIDRWFDRAAQSQLGALASSIEESPSDLAEALWCSFSRLIITKEAGASRARDVSHSRPHIVRDGASFNPIERFQGAAQAVMKRHRQIGSRRPADGRLRLRHGDARRLPLADGTVNVVITSPPYLQAIDYMRGHRLSLVWMGHTIAELRQIRGEAIGSERGGELEGRYSSMYDAAIAGDLPRASQRLVARYISDLASVLREIQRILAPNGTVIIVVADAIIRAVRVSLAILVQELASAAGLDCVSHTEREIPAASRYLPPPVQGGSNSLDGRMKREHCLIFSGRRPNPLAVR